MRAPVPKVGQESTPEHMLDNSEEGMTELEFMTLQLSV